MTLKAKVETMKSKLEKWFESKSIKERLWILGSILVALIVTHMLMTFSLSKFEVLFETGYMTALLMYCLYYGFWLGFLATIIPQIRPFTYTNMALKWLVVLIALVTLTRILPITGMTNTDKTVQPHTVYVTYSDKCPYCKISESNMRHAVNLYNATHTKTVKVVDIEKDTKLAKSVKQYIQKKGTVIVFGEKADQYNSYQVVYTLSDLEGNPVRATPNHIYRYLVELSTRD